MKWFSNCAWNRQRLCLLAAGVLPESEQASITEHLAGCPECRNYYAEIKAVTMPLANWPQTIAPFEPSSAARDRWRRAVRTAGHRGAASPHTNRLPPWWLEVFWPHRRIWAGLAAIWVGILMGNLSLHERFPVLASKTSPSAQDIATAFKDRQILLSEVLANHTLPLPPPETEPRKSYPIKPRTQRVEISAV
jgi:anti-sigma factor RsiW